MTCLFLVPKEGSEKMAALLTRNLSAKNLGEDIVKLATLEWANIMITNTINVFSDSLGSAMLSSPPEFMEAPIQEVIQKASDRIADAPNQTVFALSGYSCESLGICCETLFVLRADSLSKFIQEENKK
jgi:chemotaxis protein CheY-P-specific phosphatase CheC